MYKIGAFSKLVNVTIRALRHYEDMGLLTPEIIDESTNYRYYGAHQIEQVNTIKALQEIGFSLKSMREILACNDHEIIRSYIEAQEQIIEGSLKELSKQEKLIKAFKSSLKGNSIQKYHVMVRTIQKRNVLSFRTNIASYDDEHALWTQLYDYISLHDIQLDDPVIAMTLYHDLDYRDTNIDIEVQVNVKGPIIGNALFTVYEAPALELACITFNGSYDQMSDITQAIATWSSINGYTLNGIMVNIHHVSPAHTTNNELWITEAGIVIEPNI